MDRPTHYATILPRKWDIGRTLCNKMIGRYGEYTTKAERVTCKTCVRRLETPAPADNNSPEVGA